MGFISIDGNEIVKYEGYCNYRQHSGYLSREQKYIHQCINKNCVYYFREKPTKYDLEEKKNKIMYDFYEIVKTRYLRHSFTKEKYNELMANKDYIYAYNFTNYYKNKLDTSDIEEAAKEMLLKSGEIDPDEMDNTIMPLDKCGTRDTNVVAKAHKSVYGDYRVFVPNGYCKKHKCYLSNTTIDEKNCIECESYRKSGKLTYTKLEIKNYKIRLNDYKKTIRKLYNMDKITASEYCKLIDIKDNEYIIKFMNSYNEGIVLRNYYNPILTNEIVTMTNDENEYEDVNIDEYVKKQKKKDSTIIEKIILSVKKVFKRLFV